MAMTKILIKETLIVALIKASKKGVLLMLAVRLMKRTHGRRCMLTHIPMFRMLRSGPVCKQIYYFLLYIFIYAPMMVFICKFLYMHP